MGTPPFDAGNPQAQERKIKMAMEWLRAELSAGPRPAGEMQERGQAAGHSKRTLQEAAHRLRIKPERIYEGNRLKYWQWALPVTPAKRGRPPKK